MNDCSHGDDIISVVLYFEKKKTQKKLVVIECNDRLIRNDGKKGKS